MRYELSTSYLRHHVRAERTPGMNFPMHLHHSFEFFGVSQGEVRCTIAEKEYRLGPGDAVLVLPNQIHSYQNHQESEATMLIFDSIYVNEFYKYIQDCVFVNPVFRFDPGVLAYMPQIWTSDNTDAISRLKIQYSTSMSYPLSAISNHVSAVPNHQVGRVTSLKTRADVAYGGVFGYELDITKLEQEELAQIRDQITFAKKIQELVFNGEFYRLRSPYEGNECAWSVVGAGVGGRKA